MPDSTMSSDISTDVPARPPAPLLEPWQLFTLAGLISAAIVAYFAGAQPPVARVFLILTIMAAAVIGLATLRTLLPLAGRRPMETASTLSERTRAALEREKTLALRAIKDLEFDRAMGKVSDGDFQEVSLRLRERAGRILRQLDAGEPVSYRPVIERELAKRVGHAPAPAVSAAVTASASPAVGHACAQCGEANDADARFCKHCGARVEAA